MATVAELSLLLNILWQGYQTYKSASERTVYFTLTDLEQLYQDAEVPVPTHLLALLTQGIKQGLYLRCTLSGTEFTGQPVYLYGYNPDLLRVNGKQNMAVLVYGQGCTNCQFMQNMPYTYNTGPDPRLPCPGFQGELVGVNSGCCTSCVPSTYVPSSRCCRS